MKTSWIKGNSCIYIRKWMMIRGRQRERNGWYSYFAYLGPTLQFQKSETEFWRKNCKKFVKLIRICKKCPFNQITWGKKSTASFRGIKKLFETLNICEVKTAFIHFVWKWTRRVRAKNKVPFKVISNNF